MFVLGWILIVVGLSVMSQVMSHIVFLFFLNELYLCSTPKTFKV